MKPHFSASQLGMLSRCGEAYRRRYILEEVIPPGVSQLKGRGVHHGAEVNFTQKIDTHRDMPVTDIVDAAVAGFETDIHGGYFLTADEESRGSQVVISEATDAVAGMARLHALEQAPEYQPIFVEKSFRIELPSASHDVLGIIDLADDADRIVDIKTSGKSKSQSEADGSIQLLMYAAGFMSQTGRMPSECRLDTVVTTKTKSYRSVVSTFVTEDDFSILANRINIALKVVASGSFMPAPTDSWQCSERFCGYARTCPFFRHSRNYTK